MDKNHILDEIKRTAKENGGKPLGVARFYAETGIKVTDWEGKYWVRWGDALHEAGFTPNTMQGSYSDEYLLDKLIELIRALGKFPVRGELKIKARHDKSFPSENVFHRAFGNKAEIAAKVIEYCNGRTGYDDIIEICSPLRRVEKSDENEPRSDDETKMGYVYLMKSGRYYKIGRSNSIGRREYDINLQLPEKAQTIHAIKTDDSAGIEAYWHRRFQSKRKNGEWFELSGDDIKAFRRRKFM